MARPEKEAAVAELKEKLSAASGVVLTDYRGLKVKEITKLRSELRKAGVEYKVVKNTLLNLAAGQVEAGGLDAYLAGPTAIAFGYKDPVTPAKVIADFAKDHKNLQIKGGLLSGKVIDLDAVKALAELPSREVLLARMLAGFQAPISGLVNVLSGTTRNLVYVLEAIRKQKEAKA
ncbi:MAG: 50S ribosomal protein L10 [Syntrophothermus sp.]